MDQVKCGKCGNEIFITTKFMSKGGQILFVTYTLLCDKCGTLGVYTISPKEI